jgi:hypothetical protein
MTNTIFILANLMKNLNNIIYLLFGDCFYEVSSCKWIWNNWKTNS